MWKREVEESVIIKRRMNERDGNKIGRKNFTHTVMTILHAKMK
jgi:hypothetical protein